MRYNLNPLYICNKERGCTECGLYCKHTGYEGFAKNPESVELYHKFMDTFEPIYGPNDYIIGFEERIKEDKNENE